MKRPRSTILCRSATAFYGAFAGCLGVVTCATSAVGDVDAGAPRPSVVLHGNVVAPPPPIRSLTKPFPGFDPLLAVAPPPAPPEPTLKHFRDDLAAVASGRRTESVRVLWLGDSHTAADFWPDAVRGPLQRRYGRGGPGFVSVGRSGYRHDGVKVTRDGFWRTFPRRPSLWVRQDDGVFGLSGIRAVPEHERSRATVEVKEALAGPLRWDFAYRLPKKGARFRIVTSEGESHLIDASCARPGAIEHLEWQTPGPATFAVDRASGEPEFFGVVVESVKAGVVLDTLGINGARIATPLAWDADTFVDEMRRRAPSLVVFAYGTNEVGDQVAPFRYADDIEKLVQRVRRGAPDTDCVFVGPTDRMDSSWQTARRVFEIDGVESRTAARLGCWYVSAASMMQRAGGFKRWSALLPPLAARDGIHLTMRGYAEMGTAIARSLLGDVSTAP
jgi:lysophospholipase L1-like esterase